ncbi:MAG: DNA polymerase Y family protein [Lachnospiraceae bacterium]|jgi:DNA polymerase-4
MDQRMDKVIFHVDVNSAFLSWEAVYRLKHLNGKLDLREIPSAVSGDMAMRRGIILAKSHPARKYGVKTGETIIEAKRKCPNLMLVPPNYGLYQQSSDAFMEILKEYTPDVEQYSIDEAFMDMTGTQRLWGGPEKAAHMIRQRIYRELGFTVNIGVSTNRLLAKMASDFEKPDQVHTLFPWELKTKMWPLPVSELFFVGRATAKKLHTMGIRTIGELAETDPKMLRSHLKKHGEVIWEFANGMDVSVVEAAPEPNKGYGNSTTIAFDVTDRDTAKMVLLALCETVAARLREHRVKAEVISVGIKNNELHHVSHQKVLSSATDITSELHRTACQLFDELWNGDPIRHLGVYASRIRDHDFTRQMDLFDQTNYEKLEKMDAAVDAIRQKFGMDAVKRASFLEGEIDHMSGGISREKRSVDYSKMNIE